MDFNHQSLRQILLEGGFNANKRSFFIWEGVTNYLIEQAVDNTLWYIVMETAPRNCIVFTYVHKGALDGSAMFEGTRHLWDTLQRSGEPWIFGLYPEHFPDYLAECGLI
jgi:O-methyltransferase involved in polyketide biosynthesis